MDMMEMGLRAAGLGEALDAAKKMVEGGAIDKILAFADALPEISRRLEAIEHALRILAIRNGRALPGMADDAGGPGADALADDRALSPGAAGGPGVVPIESLDGFS
jgi:hypothetical protein